MGKRAEEARARLFGLKLSQVGRVVWRGMAGTGGDSSPVAPKQIFRKGMNWNYDGLNTPIDIKPSVGIVRGAISTSKSVDTAIHYAGSIMGTDPAKSGWVYAIYCKRGIDYIADFINNPLLGQSPLPPGVKTRSKAKLVVNEGALPTIEMTGVGANNLEIIMMNVDAQHVIAARPVVRGADLCYLAGNVQENPTSKLKRENPDLYKAVITVLAGYDSVHDFTAWSPDVRTS